MRLIGVGLGAAVFLIGAAEAAAPDLSGLAPVARNSIERACSAAAKRSADAYADCLNKQLDGMKAGPAMPSLDSLSADARAKAEKACTNAFNRGPAAYATCLNEQVAGAQPATGTKTTAPATAAKSAAFAWPAWQGQRPPMPAGLGKKELKPAEVFNAAAPSVYVVIAGKTYDDLARGRNLKNAALGSAVAISDKLVVTNCHVVDGRPAILLVQDKAVGVAKLKLADPNSDRCFVESTELALKPIAGVRPYTELKVGERVYSIGAPSGLERTLAEGLISGLRRDEGLRLVQTSAPVSHGSSGGGLFDSRGNLIGITTFGLRGTQNLNFAIAAADYWG